MTLANHFFEDLYCNNQYQSFIIAFFSRNWLGQWYVSANVLQGKNYLKKFTVTDI